MENIAPALLNWFYANRRILPFREDPTPYHVWLSEIMLQQTRVSAALPYYERFLAALPDIPALAGCEEEKLHKLWEGLGYYSRVRNLQKAAKIVCAQYGGQLPADYNALLALPGIGEYTAGAIASISFGLPVPAVDGNVLRVFARLYNDPRLVTDPQVKREFTARVMEHQPPAKAGDYNQALMELGALVCLPNGAPLCEQCPLGTLCRARAAGTALSLPQKTPPKARRITPVTVALVLNEGRVLLQQRPAKGLLAGLWQPLLWEGEALSAGSADIGFISGGNYVLFSDDCDVLLTALRYAINKDSENPADWNDGTIEENTKDMSTYYRCIICLLYTSPSPRDCS